ncbi:MAG: glucosamine-6-phosphate deaminase [Planctomycetes bacterium]|nr:glucosamine-6-phosphate deaminase [Planctomycetota bacterium]
MRSLSGTPIPTLVFDDRAELARALADEIEALVRRPTATVLGLATGSTPLDAYRELARRRREAGLSFARTTTFNLDEFVGLPAAHAQSFRRWTREHLFQHADFARTCFPDVEAADLEAAARAFEDAIRAAGGIDLQILGLGRNGHVAFNEPGSARDSRTRAVELHPWTREDAARDFGGLEHVPLRAVTMGVATILEARRLRVLALGSRKAAIVRETLRASEGPDVPSTFLRAHPDVRLLLDGEAAALL